MAVFVPVLLGAVAVDYVFDFGWLSGLKNFVTCHNHCHVHEDSESCCVDKESKEETAE